MTKMTHGRIPRGLVSVHADGGNPPDVNALVEALNKAFADFKAEQERIVRAYKTQEDHAYAELSAFAKKLLVRLLLT